MLLLIRPKTIPAALSGIKASQNTQLELQRGAIGLGFLREKWNERDVLALPPGEHDYFDRKSGDLLNDRQNFDDKVSAAVSAFANSGGGHLILGQKDNGTIDGVKSKEGKQPIREWLEVVIPDLVQYPLTSLRVHAAERELSGSQIPEGRELIVIDIGDSRFAPHQAIHPNKSKQYYFRQAGHSIAAPHHFLEALRNRYMAADLRSSLVSVSFRKLHRGSSGPNVAELALKFKIENIGRIAALRWALNMGFTESSPHIVTGESDQRIGRRNNCRLEHMILPTRSDIEYGYFGLILPPSITKPFILEFANSVVVTHQVVTENSVGEHLEIPLGPYISSELAESIVSSVSNSTSPNTL